jgi:hypothetical protein
MRAAFAIALALGLAACESVANSGGTADYDALRRATQGCESEGGKLVLKPGGDAQYIQDYACEKRK